MLDLALLRSIHVFALTAFQENDLDLLIEEFLRLGVSGIQAVMVNEEGLVLQPLRPAVSTDLTENPLPEIVSEGGFGQPGGVILATDALHCFH